MKKDVLIIGGGPAGMAALDTFYELGMKDVLLCERSDTLGGLLPQCIHDGFGLIKLGKNIAGPEYAELYMNRLTKQRENIMLEATVSEIKPVTDTAVKEEGYLVNAVIATANGKVSIDAKAVLMATGCRERSRGAADIPGTRPAGVYTAGTAQALVNLHNLIIGNSAVIVGSGDIGLIMARRLTLEGVDVKCIVEIDSISGGLPRNIRQCVRDFDIPMYFDTSVSEIYGDDRVTGVRLSNGMEIECDTVILSVGLIPENSLLDHKNASGKSYLSNVDLKKNDSSNDSPAPEFLDSIFICGNALYVHGLVDDVSNSGERVAAEIYDYISGREGRSGSCFSRHQLRNVNDTRDAERSRLAKKREELIEKSRSGKETETITCILCPNSCEISLDGSGAKCEKGIKYVKDELAHPSRVLTTSVIVWSDIISVRTSKPIPKEHIPIAMERIRSLRFGPDCAASFRGEPLPPRPMIRAGDVLVKDFIDGADLIATRGNVKL